MGGRVAGSAFPKLSISIQLARIAGENSYTQRGVGTFIVLMRGSYEPRVLHFSAFHYEYFYTVGY